MSRRVTRQLPFALVGTALVVVAPALLAAVLPGGPLVAVPACIALSAAAFAGTGAVWRRLPQSRDVLFSDLMLWGWLRRLRTERRLERVESLVIYSGGPVETLRSLRGLQRATTMLENRDAYTRRHSHRVTRHCEGIARELGLPDDEVARVRTAAALHDIGKFLTPRAVLNKPGKLTDEEFAIIKKHPGDGADMVAGVVEPAVVAMIRHHHERGTGGGYPDGLVGDAIPLGARIIAVADTFDAMTSTRAYRTARPHARALRVLREEAGTALDARVVDAFLDYYSGRRAARWSNLASSLPHAVTPFRELVLSGGRALPALGASAAVLAAPGVTAVPAPTAAARPDRTATVAANTTAAATPRMASHSVIAEMIGRATGGTRLARKRARPQAGAPRATGRPGSAHAVPPRRPNGGSGSAPAKGTGGNAGSAGGNEASAAAPGAAPAAPAASPAAPGPTAAPADPAPVATPAPEVQVDPVTVQAGEVEVQTPPVEVNLPDLPLDLPPVHLP